MGSRYQLGSTIHTAHLSATPTALRARPACACTRTSTIHSKGRRHHNTTPHLGTRYHPHTSTHTNRARTHVPTPPLTSDLPSSTTHAPAPAPAPAQHQLTRRVSITSAGPDTDVRIVLRPALHGALSTLATLAHSNHTLSPYTRALSHFTVRSAPRHALPAPPLALPRTSVRAWHRRRNRMRKRRRMSVTVLMRVKARMWYRWNRRASLIGKNGSVFSYVGRNLRWLRFRSLGRVLYGDRRCYAVVMPIRRKVSMRNLSEWLSPGPDFASEFRHKLHLDRQLHLDSLTRDA